MIPPQQITGWVLAGGRGSRMGGVDKGLQPHLGQPLVSHALERLRPQVGPLMINANRHLDEYARWGLPVWPDAEPGFPGPLAGVLAGLTRSSTPWLATVPCDSPQFPTDLVARLAQAAVESDADIALAATREPDGRTQLQPVFSLLRRSLAASLSDFMRGGELSIAHWSRRHRCATVVFDEASAFVNANTPDELLRLQPVAPPR